MPLILQLTYNNGRLPYHNLLFFQALLCLWQMTKYIIASLFDHCSGKCNTETIAEMNVENIGYS